MTEEANAAHHKVDLSTDKGNAVLTVDLNQVGNPEATVSVAMGEAVKEIFNRAKGDNPKNPKVRLEVVGTTFVVYIDTDQDGVPAVTAKLNPFSMLSKVGS